MRVTRAILAVWIIIGVCISGGIAHAQWKSVVPGIEYQKFRLDGPINVDVARADRQKKNWIIDTCIGQGTLRSGCETVSQMAERYDDSVNLYGELYDVKVAVNGDYFSFETCRPPGGQITSGWFVKRFGEYSGGSGFIWTFDRQAFLGGNVRNGKKLQKVVFSDASDMKISNINAKRGPDELILYTQHYADRTYTATDGVEVLIHMDRPLGLATGPGPTTGRIVDMRQNEDSTLLPFDHVVLSGHGSAAKKLLDHAKVGQKLRFDLGLKDYGVNELKPRDWRNVRASMGGHFYCVMEGKVPAERWEKKGKPGAINRHPRTAVALNDSYVYFIVADGRSKESVGMTITELGNFCVEHLKASYAIAQDGGGSSTMWIDGKVMNVPSDGKLRGVANGYMMVFVSDSKRSQTLSPGSRFKTKNKVELRLGPGTNYGIARNITAGQTGEIIQHQLNGVYAKKNYWWKCRLGQTQGWLPEDKMEVALRRK
ncbi:MAG: phosphodiester glycosidase family protein [Planctomycetota bacterium]|nr:MAG: phosphodiester glycosidase family protein [Planctomycetota bacterium]